MGSVSSRRTHRAETEGTRRLSSAKPNEIISELAGLRESFESNPERLPPEKPRARHLKDVFACLDRRIDEYESLADTCQEHVAAEDAVRRAAAQLPTGEVVEKIVRYESALLRQLFRSLNHLERLQRRRLGETVPPPMSLDVSSHT
jgi:hypothetical protein